MNYLFYLIVFVVFNVAKVSSQKFTKFKYKFKTSYLIEINQLIGRLELTENLSKQFEFEINSSTGYSDFIKLDSNTLEIRSNKILGPNFIDTNLYFKIILKNKLNKITQSVCYLQIDVKDPSKNTAPRFSRSIYETQIYEFNAPDQFLFKVEAFDADLNENSRLTYHLINNTNSPFQIKPDSGEVFVKRVLNSEIKPSYVLNILAIDNGINRLSASTQLLVYVLPRLNLNSPEFNLTLNEDLDFTKKPQVFKLLNQSSNLIYSLHGSLNDLNTFEIDQTGSIKLVSKLNYDVKISYKLSIITREQSLPTKANYSYLNIKIKPSGLNPPVFTAPFYEFILFDSTEPYSQIGQVKATDRFNSTLKYSIENEDNFSFFKIDSDSGWIYLLKKLAKSTHEFYVNCVGVDSIKSVVKIKIKILDQLDLVPEFSKKQYSLNISEESSVGIPLLTLNVLNKDVNSVLDFSIIEEYSTNSNQFSLIKQSNNRCYLSLEKNLNYKKVSQYDLRIKVIDQDGFYSVSKIEVNVVPNIKYSPRFTRDLYQFKINENLEPGSFIGSIQAVFEDNDVVVYKLSDSLEQDQVLSYFKLDQKSGSLYLNTRIDHETYETITIYINCFYADKPSRKDHSIIQIQILDSNDNRPEFTRAYYSVNLYPNSPKGLNLIRVEALDQDSDLNSDIKYSIEINNWLEIDQSSGVIYVAKDLDQLEPNQLNLTLTASDSGSPVQMSYSYLILNILNQPYSAPIFELTRSSFYLNELDSGSVIVELVARDPNGVSEINYQILNNLDLFELKPSGILNRAYLVNKRALNLNSDPSEFNLTIRASTRLSFTDTNIKLFIKNDYFPFVPYSFKIIFNNYKNFYLTEKSSRVPVEQFDLVHNLSFVLDTIGKELVNLDPRTGLINLKPHLNSNNNLNTSFYIFIKSDHFELKTKCDLIINYISDDHITNSVTLSLFNFDLESFLNFYMEKFLNYFNYKINLIDLNSMDSGVLNLTVSHSHQQSKAFLSQLIYSNLQGLQTILKVQKIIIYEDESCSIEPCLNYQQCLTNSKFKSAALNYIYSSSLQFRPIHIQHDFKCLCADGFTGTNTSLTCDLEINLCYSNPCGSNGTCLSLESSYTCICEPGFTGKNCELKLQDLKCESLAQNTNFCKSGSVCKNLILGGFVCDKCSIQGANQFCELRSKTFSAGSYLVLPGLKDRFRFKIKLSFSTKKTNAILFANGRLDHKFDFIALKIEQKKLKFEYSLGSEVTELRLDAFTVSDGKLRTLTIEYQSRNVTLSLDNDNFSQIDSCELNNSTDCIRVSNTYQLAAKCSNQIENCFRYLDLNGPLLLGKHFLDSSSDYEGCLADVYINDRLVDLKQDALFDSNTRDGCSTSPQTKILNFCAKNPCFNSGKCVESNQTCLCLEGYKGKYCQYEKKKLKSELNTNLNCPAKWWGIEPGICGPCKCDESKNFSPDCNKTTGECECKSKFYKKLNKQTLEYVCVPCDCFLEGSNSLQCDPNTGQCPCIPGSGITGRRCDQCVSPLAEMSPKGNECRQLNSNQCPKSVGFNTQWPRTLFNQMANSSCPKGSIGSVFRKCTDNGWAQNLDLSDCKSLKLIDSQLFKWNEDLYLNRSELNSYLSFKIVEDLDKLGFEADEDEDSDDDFLGSNLKQLSTKSNSLYAYDLLVIKNLTKQVLNYEIESLKTNTIYIQDRSFMSKVLLVLNRLFNKRYDLKINQFMVDNQFELFSDLLISLFEYINLSLKFVEKETSLNLDNVKHQVLDMIPKPELKFKYKLNPNFKRIAYSSLNLASYLLPNSLLISSNSISSLNYKLISNLFIINTQKEEAKYLNNKLIIEFDLLNNYDLVYDSKSGLLNYKNLKLAKHELVCVYLNQNLSLWESRGARLLQYESSTNLVKCEYEKLDGIYAVLSQINKFENSDLTTPINFSIIFNIFMSFSLFFLLLTLFVLILTTQIKTSLNSVYINLLLNSFLMHFIFFTGVNSNSSQLICKFVSILQHYFNLTSYTWLLLIGLHLYRMLTELRDINKIGSSSPIFYYVIGYLAPLIVVCLTLGIKQELYTNYDYTINFLNYPINKLDLSSVYCWLNLNNFDQIGYVYILPIGLLISSLFVLLALSYAEIKKTNFKQTDLDLVQKSLIICLILIPFKVLITIFLILFLNKSTQFQNLNEFNIYQHLYLLFTVLYSLVMFFLLIILNKELKFYFKKLFLKLKKDEKSMNKPKLSFINTDGFKYPTLNKNKNVQIIDVNKVMLDYNDFHNHTNSVSTTTTDGTFNDNQNMNDSTNYGLNQFTDTTGNTESDYNYNYEFNRPITNNTNSIPECDVVDVGQVLKNNRSELFYTNIGNLQLNVQSGKYYNWQSQNIECDSSFQEGNDIYTPSKLPFVKNSLIPDLVSGISKANSPSNSDKLSKSSLIISPDNNCLNVSTSYKIANVTTLTRPSNNLAQANLQTEDNETRV